jgi:DnaD/phage-associated family protein
MARGRMIAATVADDKRFNELPIDAALVYLMAIPQLDRDGLILGEPGALWGQVCRRRNDLLPHMDAIIAAWLASGLATAYKNEDGDTILHFVGFQKNQAMTHYDREAASRFPCPPGYVRTPKGLALDEVRSNSGVTPDEVPPNLNQSNANQSNAKEAEAAAVFACWKDNMPGMLTTIIADDLGDLVDTYGGDTVIRAITEAVRHNGRSVRYVSTILESWASGKSKPGPNSIIEPAQVATANGTVKDFDVAQLLGGA